MRKILPASVILLTATNVFASGLSPVNRYQQIHIQIQNNTKHIEIINMYDFIGSWRKPVSKQEKFTLPPHAVYRNTLMSVMKSGALENYANIQVSQADSPHENYLIFGEDTNSQYHSISAHIFDGLGPMFVDSQTNHCDAMAADGFTNCTLDIRA